MHNKIAVERFTVSFVLLTKTSNANTESALITFPFDKQPLLITPMVSIA